jgi:hypothetical protein
MHTKKMYAILAVLAILGLVVKQLSKYRMQSKKQKSKRSIFFL